MLFFKAFEAGFYKAPGKGDVLGNIPKRIEVEYFVKIPAAKLSQFTIDSMRDNLNAEEMDRIKEQIQLMRKYFVDLKPGDRFSLTYIPSAGTKFSYNGSLVGVIPGDDFAKAIFSVWVGNKPFDQRLKDQVLGAGLKRA